MILILPGMGADNRMYGSLWRSLPDAVFYDWPTDYIPASIADLAQYIRQGLAQAPDLIIGSSLGGMVGLELSRVAKTRSVALIGSAVSYDEVHPLLRSKAAIFPGAACNGLPDSVARTLQSASLRAASPFSLWRSYVDSDL